MSFFVFAICLSFALHLFGIPTQRKTPAKASTISLDLHPTNLRTKNKTKTATATDSKPLQVKWIPTAAGAASLRRVPVTEAPTCPSPPGVPDSRADLMEGAPMEGPPWKKSWLQQKMFTGRGRLSE